MGMESVYKLSVVLNMIDNMSGAMNSVSNSTTSSINKLNAGFASMQKAGAILGSAGIGITSACIATVASTFETKDALGELASLGVKDLKAVEDAAKSFSDTWAGTTKAEFISASYDIKSGIASLSDVGVAEFTRLSGITAKATKSTTQEMTSLFATGYGIYKNYYSELSDMEFGEMFSAGIATAVKNYKTNGSEMASSISMLGATATNANVSLEEQLAILGQLQMTMSGSEAATKYKSFLNTAAAAGETLGLTFTDTNNQLLSMPEIIDKLKSKYGETIDAVEKQDLKKAFGTDEAIAAIDLLYGNVGVLESGIDSLGTSMKNGTAITEEMANAINDTPANQFKILKQQVHNATEELGNGLLPAINENMESIKKIIKTGSDWISNNKETVSTIMNIVFKLGIFLTVVGGVILVIGTVGRVVLYVINTIRILKVVMVALNATFLATPIGWIILAIVALVAGFVLLWNKSEAFRNFWINMWNGIGNAFTKVKNFIGDGLKGMGSAVSEKLNAMKETYQSHGGGIKGIAAVAMEGMKGIYKGGFNILDSLTGGKLSSIKEKWSQGMQNIKDLLANAPQWFLKSGAKIMDTFTAGIKASISKPVEAVKGALQKIRNMLPFSDAKTGPLSRLTLSGKRVFETMATGMDLSKELPGEVARQGLQDVSTELTNGTSLADSLSNQKASSLKGGTSFRSEYVGNSASTKQKENKNTIIEQLTIAVDFSRIKELPLLYKLIDEVKNANNGYDDPEPETA